MQLLDSVKSFAFRSPHWRTWPPYTQVQLITSFKSDEFFLPVKPSLCCCCFVCVGWMVLFYIHFRKSRLSEHSHAVYMLSLQRWPHSHIMLVPNELSVYQPLIHLKKWTIILFNCFLCTFHRGLFSLYSLSWEWLHIWGRQCHSCQFCCPLSLYCHHPTAYTTWNLVLT